MSSKNEKIKSAWEKALKGEMLYSKIECYLSMNGWLPIHKLNKEIRLHLAIKHINLFELKDDFLRPIELKGIENNNGWVKVKSFIDLPKEDGLFLVFNDGKTSDILFNKRTLEMMLKNKQLTYYKKINDPLLPVY
ncbi:hypothetical protein [Riemerella anatipestifer]|uniref:hypothetical protein n=1 Tax=Riemerella anatipestifer TaxID=34085 RepID=UPI0007ED4E4E|nr:hypothetical protein [Riemerella anatipestifer]MCU7570450.1 hypothetical protein [Riemerella anatipestifer]MCW0507973.1 hypothetical protein [Riemerella anatipestifer]MCW0518261.1 hypothetical protein [Riemerella anatipestifer]MDY3524923.1 hypothetical protein [Riemerella anatipestifer]OBP46923.1 hypothetical protein AWM67_08525 [Riemerella anatipestifer]